MIFLKLGFLNVLRNKRRTFLTATAIGVGLSALIIIDGVMLGMQKNMIETATSGPLGEAQVHHDKFLDENEVEYTINHFDKLKEKLEARKEVVAWSERTLSQAMISSPNDSRNIILYGIKPFKEKKVNSLLDYLIEGTFLKSKKGIILGRKLLKNLKAELGDKIILTQLNVKTKELSQEQFRIEGVASFGSKEMDSRLAFIHLEMGQKILGLEEKVHEVVIKLESLEMGGIEDLPIWDKLSENNNLAQGWSTLAPGLSIISRMSNKSTAIITTILSLLVSIGVINTLFMSIYERMYEFGILRALGTSSYEIFKMIVSESFFIGLFSLLVSFFLTLMFGSYIGYYGIDYGGIEFNNVTFQKPIYFILKWYHYTLYPIIEIFFITFIGFYPAISATKITMARAIKKTL